ncbi:MAG TPA: alpha/beta hydrolase, partial [Minicystis sp.]|nr:alpha/beta hydrolase [Minicystis sp.]
LLHGMSFGAFNKPFSPARTPFDWISRDAAEVDAYAADPLSGFVVTTSLWVDVLDALADNADPARQARIPKDLPVYVFAGSEDPVGERTKSVDQLLGAWRRAGMTRVTHRYYPGARHETLNETNRDEVTRDLLAWLEANVPPR